MMLENVLVDEIGLKDGPTAVVNSTLYEFGKPRWVSLHEGREGQALGPITLLPDKGTNLSNSHPSISGNDSYR
jgi:hypothetical protein